MEPYQTKTCTIHNTKKVNLTPSETLPRLKIWVCLKCNEERELLRKLEEKESKENEVRERIRKSNIPKRFMEKTFENYIIEKEKQRHAINIIKRFLKNSRSPGLILIGKKGTGKNHLACAAAKEYCKQGSVHFTEIIKLIRNIKNSWNKESDINEIEIMRKVRNYGLLVIDEIGVQFGSETEKILITEIINDRYNDLKPTILIGNLTINELEKTIGERGIDRFREGGRVVVFDWKSYRGENGSYKK